MTRPARPRLPGNPMAKKTGGDSATAVWTQPQAEWFTTYTDQRAALIVAGAATTEEKVKQAIESHIGPHTGTLWMVSKDKQPFSGGLIRVCIDGVKLESWSKAHCCLM